MQVNSDCEHLFRAIVRVMRYHLLWYVPLGVWVVLYFIVPNLVSGFNNLALVFYRFSWAVLFSPSTYVFFAAVFTSLVLPVQLFLLIPGFFERGVPMFQRRYLWALGVVLGIAISAVLTQTIIWGSFPLPTDKYAYIHVRMIPFIPWPDTPLFQ